MFYQGLQWFIERVVETIFSNLRSWESFTAAIGRVPTVFVDFSGILAWPYLLSSLVLAWLIYAYTRETESAGSFREFAFPYRIYRHPSTTLDFRFMVVDVLLAFLLYVPIYTAIRLVGTKMMSYLMIDQFSWQSPRALSPAAAVLSALGFILLLDLVNYWSHVWFHKIPLLWPFHQVHHSAEVLTPVTGNRVHPVENIIVAALQAPVFGLAAVCYQNVIGPDREFLMIGGVTAIGFTIALLGTHLRHSHIWFSFGPWLNRVLMCPAHHQIHHSLEPRHWNKNFGTKFTIWDALFGTLYSPHHSERFQIGLPNNESAAFTTVRKLYLMPFVYAVRQLFTWLGRTTFDQNVDRLDQPTSY
jgi:sterol desaturase/sphingolipid hydroxylase (fatty acid hydroxylase superfamily)